MAAGERSRAGRNGSVLPAGGPIQLHARRLSAGRLRRTATRHSPDGEFDVGRMRVDGGVQITALAEHRRQRAERPGDLLRRGGAVPGRPPVGELRASACSPTRASTATRRTASSRSTTAAPASTSIDVHIVNLRNTYQFTPALLRARGRAIRLVARARADRLSRLVRAVAGHRRARGLRVAVRNGARELDFDRYTATARAFFFKRPTGCTSDRRHQPAGALAIAPVRMEQRRMVERAQRAHMNVLRRHAGALELIAGRAPQIEVRLRRRAREPARRPRDALKMCPRARRRPHSSTGRCSDRRPRRLSRLACRTATSAPERPPSPRLPQCPSIRRERPPPRRSRRSARRIGTQSAALTLSATRRIVADGDVGFRPVSTSGPRGSPCGREDIRAVHLPHADERVELDAHRAAEHCQLVRLVVARTFEREIARAEAVWRDVGERPASQRRAPRLLHPLEVAARLG